MCRSEDVPPIYAAKLDAFETAHYPLAVYPHFIVKSVFNDKGAGDLVMALREAVKKLENNAVRVNLKTCEYPKPADPKGVSEHP